jgi:hypothetical protein
MLELKNQLRICDNVAGAFAAVKSHKVRTFGISTLITGLFAVMGAGNYTAVNTPIDISSAGPGLMFGFSLLLDMVTAMGNWYVTNALGELYVAMACLLFVFILIKSLFRHSGGRRR